MRMLASVAGLLALGYTAARAVPDFPPGAEAFERQSLGTYDSYWQNWIKEQARTIVSSGRISEDRARSLALGARIAAHADVNVTSFLILMQAARDADADLQNTMDRQRDARAEQDELSSIARSRAPTVSQLSPETQTVLSEKGRVRPVMTWQSNGGPPQQSSLLSPSGDADLSIHLDMQTAMEHESAASEALSAAAQRLPLKSSAPGTR
ncbi:MAG: hypothetical protein JOY77_10780 [Alphaproteobacteria bacterium]|nr:hypothetical protein [Alphaproteobacteria bacterium]MBV9063393.1 hypothetical protein [Alphaproteobacteria bacterium]